MIKKYEKVYLLISCIFIIAVSGCGQEIDKTKAVIENTNNKVNIDKKTEITGYTLNQYYRFPQCGYNVKCNELSEDELTMKLQAGDSDYDFLILDTRHSISRNLKDKKAYAALNEVDEIDDYFERCNYYIKDVAKNEDGSIWMLPLDIDCPVLMFNEEATKESGMDIEALDTYEKFIDYVYNLPKEDSHYYSMPYFMVTEDIVYRYLDLYAFDGKKVVFDTDIMKRYMDIMKKYDKDECEGTSFSVLPGYMEYSQDEKESINEKEETNWLFEMSRSSEIIYDIYYNTKNMEHYKKSNYVVKNLPVLDDSKDERNAIECTFILVNPESAKKDIVKQYISDICKEITDKKESIMLKDFDTKGDPILDSVKELLKDGNITLEYPRDIIGGELEKYRFEGQDYKTTVSEMERNLSMYLWE